MLACWNLFCWVFVCLLGGVVCWGVCWGVCLFVCLFGVVFMWAFVLPCFVSVMQLFYGFYLN